MAVNYPAASRVVLHKDYMCVCVFIFSQERGHPYSRHFSCAGHSGQTADLAVHLPATDLWRAGALPEQTVSLPRFQEQWWVHVVVIHCFLFSLKQNRFAQNVCYVCFSQLCWSLKQDRSITGGAAPCAWRGRRTAASSERGALTTASSGLTWEWVRST